MLQLSSKMCTKHVLITFTLQPLQTFDRHVFFLFFNKFFFNYSYKSELLLELRFLQFNKACMCIYMYIVWSKQAAAFD